MIRFMFVMSLFLTANLYSESNSKVIFIEESLDDTAPSITRSGDNRYSQRPSKIILYKKEKRIQFLNRNFSKMTFDKNRKNIVLKNDTWGPLPVSILIVDTQGQVVATESNEEDSVTTFVFPVSIIKEGYIIKAYNAFEDLIFEAKIIIKE